MPEITEQIVREAPEIEAYKVGLLRSAKALSDQPVNLPSYSVAGFNPDQVAAFEQARSGIGAYQPYLYGGSQALNRGIATTGEAADVLRGADTRNQYAAAQEAMNLSGMSAGQLGNIAGQVNPAYGMLGTGTAYTDLAARQAQQAMYQPGFQQAMLGTGRAMGDIGTAQQAAFNAAGVDLGSAQGALRQAQQQAFGASGADYGAAQGLMGAGIGQLLGGTGQYNPASVSSFMNPYQQQVIDAATQEINRQRDITAQQQGAQAVASGAFGGSRQAIQRAELERNTEQLRNQTIANLLSQGYTQAQAQSQAAFEAQQARQQAAGQGIGQQAALAGQLATQQAQLGQSGAQAAGQLAAQEGQLGLAGGQLGLSAAQTVGQQAAAQGQLAGQLGSLAAQQGQLGLQGAGLTGQLGSQYGQFAGQQGALAGQQANIFGQQAGLYGSLGQGIGSLASQQYGIGQNMAQTLGGFGAQLGNLGVQQGAMGQTAQQLGQQDVNFLYNIGQQQQALTQQQLDAQRNTQLQQAYEPYQRLGFLSDIYKGAPTSQQSITAATAPVPSAFQQAVGTGIAGLTAGTAAKKAGLF